MAEFQARQKSKTEDWASFADELRLLAEKAYPDLQAEAQEALALYRFLTQLDNPQVNFAVRQKQPANVDQALQYTLDATQTILHIVSHPCVLKDEMPQLDVIASHIVNKLIRLYCMICISRSVIPHNIFKAISELSTA